MKPTETSSRGNTRNGAKSAKPSLVEFPAKKTASAKARGQAPSPSPTGSMNSKNQTKTSGSGNGNGSRPKGVPKDLVSLKRATEALRRLRVTAKELEAAPQITPLLKKADGGLKRVLMAMRLAQDEVI